ncbi:MAG TPA: hypothetical protein PKD90_06235 [Phnomibacter sp.]|nr:hypothetical protein [Phnomibacter sp.]
MRSTKLIITVCLSAFLLGTASYAQPPERGGGKGEALESLRVAFISRQLELSPEEAQKFWPVYNKYQTDLQKMAREHREKGGTELELEEKVLNLRKQYKGEFTKTISEQKFDKLLKAERTWGDMLRKELQRRREGNDRPLLRQRN